MMKTRYSNAQIVRVLRDAPLHFEEAVWFKYLSANNIDVEFNFHEHDDCGGKVVQCNETAV